MPSQLTGQGAASLEESLGRARGHVARSQFAAYAVQTHLPDNVRLPWRR